MLAAAAVTSLCQAVNSAAVRLHVLAAEGQCTTLAAAARQWIEVKASKTPPFQYFICLILFEAKATARLSQQLPCMCLEALLGNLVLPAFLWQLLRLPALM